MFMIELGKLKNHGKHYLIMKTYDIWWLTEINSLE